jgi:resolvase-like protein
MRRNPSAERILAYAILLFHVPENSAFLAAKIEGRLVMAVYGYARVSTIRQADDGVSLDEQQRRIRGRALEEGWEIAAMHVEEGVSGSMPFAERPQGKALLDRVQPGDIIIAAKLDRASRSALDARISSPNWKAGTSSFICSTLAAMLSPTVRSAACC